LKSRHIESLEISEELKVRSSRKDVEVVEGIEVGEGRRCLDHLDTLDDLDTL
jgi:hypothetical protein